MRLLLDTHTFLWWCANDTSLSERAMEALSDGDNDVYLSAVSGWEIAIKARLGKLQLPEAPRPFLSRMLELHGFGVLPVNLTHAVAEFELPVHHSDPFDRLLIVQSQLEDLTLVTNDRLVQRYEVRTLW